jgi:hypothetical protein
MLSSSSCVLDLCASSCAGSLDARTGEGTRTHTSNESFILGVFEIRPIMQLHNDRNSQSMLRMQAYTSERMSANTPRTQMQVPAQGSQGRRRPAPHDALRAAQGHPARPGQLARAPPRHAHQHRCHAGWRRPAQQGAADDRGWVRGFVGVRGRVCACVGVCFVYCLWLAWRARACRALFQCALCCCFSSGKPMCVGAPPTTRTNRAHRIGEQQASLSQQQPTKQQQQQQQRQQQQQYNNGPLQVPGPVAAAVVRLGERRGVSRDARH